MSRIVKWVSVLCLAELTMAATCDSPSPVSPYPPFSAAPEGLTGGLTYTQGDQNVVTGYVETWNGTATERETSITVDYVASLLPPECYQGVCPFGCSDPNDPTMACSCCTPAYSRILGTAPGWLNVSDGDHGLGEGYGFYHQELTGEAVTFDDAAGLYSLPAGTACGFHHTQDSPADTQTGLHTCMGNDAYVSCPSGWMKRSHFDDSSGSGHFAWCEYTDPNHLCTTAQCVAEAVNAGVTIGIYSNTDETGGTVLRNQACPAGTQRTAFFDDGRSSGQGLSWCLANTIP